MGVPALFRWLSNKYPKIISPVIEQLPYEINGEEVPVDTTGPNPNGEEMDNLYLDMNGIVHPCTHPEGKPPPQNEQEMMLEIFKYTDRVVNMVRPRKLLMIAIDGVAPRAKMNQQRARRFRSAQEAKEADEKKEEFKRLAGKQNSGSIDEDLREQVIEKTWDSNVITPGTPFMDILASSLRYWIAYKLNTDPAWEKLKIIISDATVPGEGEHKIMEFVRSQRAAPEHDPNTRHVIYGLDADLIMLGLATHEPHFHVLREDVFFQESKARTCGLCGRTGHKAEECRGQAKTKNGEFDEKQAGTSLKPFIWLHVSVLREYLAVELRVPQQSFPFDLERALDDWVFMCFFVGNDFLPHLPSLDIRENGIDTLIAIWRDNLPVMGGYLTKDGQVDFKKAQIILQGLAKQESSIFRRRRQADERRRSNEQRRKQEQKARDQENRSRKRRRSSPDYSPPATNRSRRGAPIPNLNEMELITPSRGELPRQTRELTHSMVVNRGAVYRANMANKSAAAALKSVLMKGSDGDQDSENDETIAAGSQPIESREDSALPSTLGKRKPDALMDQESETATQGTDSPSQLGASKEDELPADTVRLWEDGYSERYYEQKFGVDPQDMEFRRKVARSYAEGLSWVLLYYFQGCPSWTWFYPYHYAPFAADFVDIEDMTTNFERGLPFKPFEQLMGVLPASSNHALPKIFHELMSSPDSEIIDFYPEDFPVDLNGKKFAWQGVILLPFIDETRLLTAVRKKYHLLTEDEKVRNSVGRDVLLISDGHPLYHDLVANFYSKKPGPSTFKLNMRVSGGLAGKAERNETYIPHSSLVSPLEEYGMSTIEEDRSLSVNYEIPKSSHIHKSMLLRGVKFPPPVLNDADVQSIKMKANSSGRSFGGAPLRNGADRGGRINYARSRPNPFAAHLDPNFVPPPSVGASMTTSGWAHPSPGSVDFSRGPPPPPRGAMSDPYRPHHAPAPDPLQGHMGYNQTRRYDSLRAQQEYYEQGSHYRQNDYQGSGSGRGGYGSQYPPYAGGGYGRY